jgi:putative DNA primase/helicase
MHHLNLAVHSYRTKTCPPPDGSMTPISIDPRSSGRFIDLLTGGTGSCTFQTFPDIQELKGQWPCPAILHGTLDQHSERLETLNRQGHGIFVCVNETDGQGRKSENIVRARSLFLDLDGSSLEPVVEAGLKPHMVVESSPGRFHVYWLVNDVVLSEFGELQSGLALRFDGDQKVKDLPRVMRLPGFLHQKGEPFPVRLLQVNHNIPTYSKQSIVRAFGLDSEIPIKEEEKLTYQAYDPSRLVSEGQRNSYMVSRAGQLRSKGNSEKEIYHILSNENGELCRPPLPDDEIKSISGWIGTKDSGRKKGRGHQSRPMDYVDELLAKYTIVCNGPKLYIYKDGYYQEQQHESIEQATLLVIENDIGNSATSRNVNEVVRLLKIKTYKDPNLFDPPGFINVKNGLIRLEDLELLSHSPDFLTTTQIRVELKPGSKCPRWQEYLRTTLPDKDQQDLLQEFFGYCLTTSIVYHKALFLQGGGGNGKSGVMAVLKALIGPSNYSSLMLSDLGTRFRPSQLHGKLVNFTGEVDSRKLLSDGPFKALVGGDSITVERKGVDPFDLTPTAKFIVAGNRMPETKDSTYGLERKLLILRFDQQFKDPSEIKPGDRALPRKPGLADSIIETELAGVLLWAIEGLRRLRMQDGFTIPRSSVEAVEEFRDQTEPAKSFVIDFIQEHEGSQLLLKDAFRMWGSYATDHGCEKKSDRNLSMIIGDVYGKDRKKPGRDGTYFVGLRLAPDGSSNHKSSEDR